MRPPGTAGALLLLLRLKSRILLRQLFGKKRRGTSLLLLVFFAPSLIAFDTWGRELAGMFRGSDQQAAFLSLCLAGFLALSITEDLFMVYNSQVLYRGADSGFLEVLPIRRAALVILWAVESWVTKFSFWILLVTGLSLFRSQGLGAGGQLALGLGLAGIYIVTGMMLLPVQTLISRLLTQREARNLSHLAGGAPFVVILLAPLLMDRSERFLPWLLHSGFERSAWVRSEPLFWLVQGTLDLVRSPWPGRYLIGYWTFLLAGAAGLAWLQLRISRSDLFLAVRRSGTRAGPADLSAGRIPGLLGFSLRQIFRDMGILVNGLGLPIGFGAYFWYTLFTGTPSDPVPPPRPVHVATFFSFAILYFHALYPLNIVGLQRGGFGMLELTPLSTVRILDHYRNVTMLITTVVYAPAFVWASTSLGHTAAAMTRGGFFLVLITLVGSNVAVALSALYPNFQSAIPQQASGLPAKGYFFMGMALVIPLAFALDSPRGIWLLGVAGVLSIALKSVAARCLRWRHDPDGDGGRVLAPDEVILLCTVSLLLQAQVQAVLMRVGPPGVRLLLLTMILVYGPLILWAAWTMKRRGGLTGTGVFHPGERPVQGLLLGLAATIPCAAAFLGTNWLLFDYWGIPNELARDPASHRELWIMVTVASPLLEEVLFRGLVLTSLLKAPMPRRRAIAVSSLVFALVHEPYRMPGAFLLGVITGQLRCRTGAVWPGLITHALANGISLGSVL